MLRDIFDDEDLMEDISERNTELISLISSPKVTEEIIQLMWNFRLT